MSQRPKRLTSSTDAEMKNEDARYFKEGNNHILEEISNYANGLTRVPASALYGYIARELKRISASRIVAVNIYDADHRELLCRHVTLSDTEHAEAEGFLGTQALDLRVPVDEFVYCEIVERTVKSASSLYEASLGAIPPSLGELLEQQFAVNFFIGLALVINKELIGTVLLAGERSTMICREDHLIPFAAVTANAVELSQTGELLAESQEWYRTIAEDVPAMVTRVNPDYIFTFVNEAYCRFFGKGAEGFIGRDMALFITAENYEQVVNHFRILTPEQPIATHEHSNIDADGSERWIRWINRAIFTSHGELKEYLSIGEDITEFKIAYQLLEESERLKSSIVEAVPDIIIRFDRNGRYIDIMSSDENALYKPKKEMVGKTLEENLPRDVARLLMGAIKRALEEKEMQTLEYTLHKATGAFEREARINAVNDHEVIAFIRDMTEKKETEKALRDSEEKYGEILDTIEEGYYEVDLNGHFTGFNDATLRMLGYAQDELMGMNYRQIYKDPETVFKTFNRVFISGKSERGFTLETVRKDGSSAYGELSISPVKNKRGNIVGFRGVARDITERILFERKLEHLSMHDQLTGLHNRAFFEQETAELEGKSAEYPITMVSVDLDDLKLVNDSLGHEAGDRLLKAAAEILKEAVRTSDTLARVGGDEFTAVLPRTGKEGGETIAARIRKRVEQYNLTSDQLPLGLSIGVATAETKEQSLMETFKQADDYMYRDKLHRNNRARNTTVEALLTALAERDYITEGHAQRLSDLCRRIGEKINLASHQLSDLALLSQVHDLGKVGIPDHILFKNGALDDEEWETMRLHSEKGYRIAKTSTDLSGIADLILKHHERWDGSGYPLGLSGVDIPIECRILAIVDAFDAITNDRPYSRAKSSAEALEEIKRCAGSQFDPYLVEVFLSICKKESSRQS